MSVRDTVKRAALVAARFALPGMAEGLVRWTDEPRVQSAPGMPAVTLSEVSLVPDGPTSRMRSLRDDGNLDECLAQRYLWTIQVKTEGYQVLENDTTSPRDFTVRMRSGWLTARVRAALEDASTPDAKRAPAKLIYQPGQVLTAHMGVRGSTLAVYLFEVPLRYNDYVLDPETIGVIESAQIAGVLSDGADAPLVIDSQS